VILKKKTQTSKSTKVAIGAGTLGWFWCTS